MKDLKNPSGSTEAFEMGLTVSYLRVPGPPLSPLTLGQLVDEAAEKWANSECYYDVPVEKRLTFAQLKNEVDSFAGGLLKIGLRKGERIGIWGPTSSRWIVTFLAAAKIGIIIVPLNPSYEAPELLYALNQLSVKCLVLAEPVKTRDLYQILNEAIPDISILSANENDDSRIINLDLAPHLKTIIYMGEERLNGTRLWTDVQKLGNKQENFEEMQRVAETVQSDDILYTPFTSGTTGRQKGAMISHHAHVNSFFQLGNRLHLNQQDRHLQTLPVFHLYGNLVSMFPLRFGCCLVFPSPTFSPSTAIEIATKEKCTWIQGTPTMHFDMINTPGFDLLDLSSLQGVVVGGAGASKALLTQMKSKYGISRVTIGYGSTEGNNLSISLFDDPPELALTSVGYPYENSETKIIDASGRIVPLGQTGEICCRSFDVMLSYWEDLEKTREAIDPAGWYHTGDAGYFLESGHLVLVGRFNDVLIRGGENIHPKEIEDFLYENLQVEQVYVFGVSDERLGEVVAAWILPKSKIIERVAMDTDHVKMVCEGNISRSKIPVHIKFVQHKDDFPRTPLGKIQKNLMRQQYEKQLGICVNEKL